ncbi:MAG: type II toxin-antitoxin system RelE/ParE family toxin [Acidobacteriota bacterium]|nr:type II toxin-antitoxin system RelE/ParE family toxin [Acidobacteriota bacterium]
MAYRVDISPSALQDAEDTYLWIKFNSSNTTAEAWYKGLLEAILSLENFPLRCSLSPETEDLGKEIRQLIFGKRGSQYRILFAIRHDEMTGEEFIHIYRIRHIARRRITSDEIREGEM